MDRAIRIHGSKRILAYKNAIRPSMWPTCGIKKGQATCLTSVVSNFRQCQYIRGQRKVDSVLSSLEIAGRHLAGLVVPLKIVAQLLAFYDFAHTCTLYSGDVHECIGAAVVWLNEAEALGGVKPFTVPVVIMNPFKA